MRWLGDIDRINRFLTIALVIELTITLAMVLAMILAVGQLAFAGSNNTFQQAQSTGSSLGSSAQGEVSSRSDINNRFFKPMTSGGSIPLYTFDNSKHFSASLTKEGGKRLVDILIQQGGTGDLKTLRVYQDLDNSNSYNYAYDVTSVIGPVSGICANGVIACTPGTWTNCKYYMWTADSSGRVSLVQRPSTDFGGCYCINNSCGSNLAISNSSVILKDLGGGVIGAIEKYSNYRVVVTGVSQGVVNEVWYGELVKSSDAPNPSQYTDSDTADYEWETGSISPAQYWSGTDAGSFYAAAGNVEDQEKSNPNSLYNLIVNSQAAKKNPYEEHTCYIRREITVTKHQNNYYTAEDDNTCPDRFDTSICKNGPEHCYTDGQGNEHCLCQLAKTGGGCGQTYDYTFCGKFTTHYYIPDDTYALIKIGSSTVLYKNAGTTGGTDPTKGTYTFSTNGSQRVLVKYYNLGGCNGTPSSYLKVYIYRKAWDTVDKEIDDQCQAYENNSNCKLKDEWVEGVQTWRDYNPTGLTPVGQVCKTFKGWVSHTFCYNWWVKKRIYACKISGWDFSKAKQRANTIVNSTKDVNVMQTSILGNVNYQDYNNSSGSWQNYNENMYIPFAGSNKQCQMVCKVKVPVQDTQAYANTNTSQYRKISSYVFDYRACKAMSSGSYVCPYDPSKGESVVTNCQCINEFANSAAIMQTLEDAGHDIICSSGVRH